MEKVEKEGSSQLGLFLMLVLMLASVAVILGMFLYKASGSEDLDRSLPRYMAEKQAKCKEDKSECGSND